MSHKKDLAAGAAAALLLSAFAVIAIFGLKQKPAIASSVVLKNHDLYLLDTTIGEKRLSTSSNIEMLFDQKNGHVLFGEQWQGAAPESENSGGSKLRVMRDDGSDDRAVTDDLANGAFFDPEGGSIYYTTRAQDLYAVNLDGSGRRKLREKVLSPALSHDGRFAVYQKLNPDWTPGQYYDRALGLAVLDLKTGKEKMVGATWEDFDPIWTPDDKKILFFSRSADGLASHFIMNADGSNRRQLTNIGQKFVSDKTVPVPSEMPIWSKDGHTLVYESDRQIWVNEFAASMDGMRGTRAIGYGKHPQWLDDGKTLRVLVGKDDDVIDATTVRMDIQGHILH